MSDTTQTTLAGDRQATADGRTDNINELLQADDAIDALSREQVRDVWVRSKFAHTLFRAGEWHDSEEYYSQVLEQFHAGALKEAATRAFGRDHELAQILEFHERGNIQTLWERWTKDDVDGDMTEIAREKLKTTLRGSGMPRITVARKRVQHHAEGER